MKKIFIAMLSLMLTMPVMAQYNRYPRPLVRHNYGSGHTLPSRHYSASTDIYYGFRIGAAFSTVNSDDRYLDGSTMRTGLDVGAVVC